MPATAKRPERPISLASLADALRDRYYLGYVTHDGMEYQGRHEALISEELFDRVQQVLDSHSGSGTRTRTHNHYLKGTVWCARCEHRFIVQRAVGNGGEYFYLFCRGRQERLCDVPYLNVSDVEEAVIRHYATIQFSDEFKEAVRARLDAALADDLDGSQVVRDRLEARLTSLATKESNLLDLAADGDLPKEMIKQKLIHIRDERAGIRRDIERLEGELETGRQVFLTALELLDQPQELYRQAGPALRKTMNETIFAKLWLNGTTVTDDALAEPFDTLVPAGRAYDNVTYHRKRPATSLTGAVAFHVGISAESLTLTDLLDLAHGDMGSSKPVMVRSSRLGLTWADVA